MLNFLKDYILTLKERDELDWFIYQLIQAKGFIPLKNPFMRTAEKELKAKRGEAEFGIDSSCFEDQEKKHLIIFVLKDEKLTAGTWKNANFSADLQQAIETDFEGDIAYKNIESVKIILAHNKDENTAGKKCFDNFAKKWALPSKAYGREISISIKRWNIDDITSEAEKYIYSSEMLPWEFNSFFNYLCTQAKEFDFNSDNWEKVFVPAWKDFLKRITADGITEKNIILINLCIGIFEKTLKEKTNYLPSQIDITEWGLLRISSLIFKNPSKNMKELIFFFRTTLTLYKRHLENYLEENKDYFTSGEAGANPEMMSMGVILDSRKAHWNLARIGVLVLLYNDCLVIAGNGKDQNFTKKELEIYKKHVKELQKAIIEAGDLLEQFIQKNDSTKRPLIDLDHIQLFLVWAVFHMSGKHKAFYDYMLSLKTNLTLRKTKSMGVEVPFIEDHNRLDLVSEYAAMGSKPLAYSCKTSYFLTIALELCFDFHEKDTEHLLDQFYYQIILPKDYTKTEKLEEESIDLAFWNPPANWETEIFDKNISRKGTLSSIGNFETFPETNQALKEKVELFVKNSIKILGCKEKFPAIRSLVVLACLKNENPLPSVLWRTTIFSKFYKD